MPRNPAAPDQGNRVAGSPSGKFPRRAVALNHGSRGKRCQSRTVAGQPLEKHSFRQKLGGSLLGDGAAQEGGPFYIKV
jgi:hypothetical protein